MTSSSRNFVAAGMLAATSILAACSSSGDKIIGPQPQPGAADITLDITSSRTLYADTVYTLKGFIHVTNQATLTIQPGTRILGDYNTLGSSLFIMRGAKIQAVGTADKPIVFTSSRAAGTRQPGDWGGLLIIGNAIDNRTGATTIEIEGSGTEPNGGSGHNYAVPYSGGTSATLLCNRVGERIVNAGANPLPDVIEHPRSVLDLSLRLPVLAGISARIDGRNLLNANHLVTQGGVTREAWTTGRGFSFGLTWQPR